MQISKKESLFKLHVGILNLEPIETIACNATLTATSERNILASPGYPLQYNNVTRGCYWDITTDQPGERVAIAFEKFKVCITGTVQSYMGASFL